MFRRIVRGQFFQLNPSDPGMKSEAEALAPRPTLQAVFDPTPFQIRR